MLEHFGVLGKTDIQLTHKKGHALDAMHPTAKLGSALTRGRGKATMVQHKVQSPNGYTQSWVRAEAKKQKNSYIKGNDQISTYFEGNETQV